MIRTRAYRCGEGCERRSAAPLDEIGGCCTHDSPWVLIPHSALDIRTASDPPETPLMMEPDEDGA